MAKETGIAPQLWHVQNSPFAIEIYVSRYLLFINSTYRAQISNNTS